MNLRGISALHDSIVEYLTQCFGRDAAESRKFIKLTSFYTNQHGGKEALG